MLDELRFGGGKDCEVYKIWIEDIKFRIAEIN